MTVDQVREIALAQLDAFESSHHDHPDFRIKKGIFATISPDGLRSALRLPLAFAEGLVAESPGTYRMAGRSGGTGWVLVTLELVDVEDYRALAEMAWQARS